MVAVKLVSLTIMPQTAMEELKAMSHSDVQRFSNYLGSRLRTIGKVYHTRNFSSIDQKIQVFHNWRKELVSCHSLPPSEAMLLKPG